MHRISSEVGMVDSEDGVMWKAILLRVIGALNAETLVQLLRNCRTCHAKSNTVLVWKRQNPSHVQSVSDVLGVTQSHSWLSCMWKIARQWESLEHRWIFIINYRTGSLASSEATGLVSGVSAWASTYSIPYYDNLIPSNHLQKGNRRSTLYSSELNVLVLRVAFVIVA